MQVTVIGAGHVGLVTSACFAEMGHSVLCMDVDEGKIDGISKGVMPFAEPGLQRLVHAHNGELLKFTTSIGEAVAWADTILICVDTPPNDDGSADLSTIDIIARQIASEAAADKIVVSKSTVPVRTGDRIAKILLENGRPGVEFDYASVPEFLREGSAVEDALHPDRIVIGVESDHALERLRTLFQPFLAPIMVTDIATAEVIKHASNSFLATKISYINAIARICELAGADVTMVAKAMGMDPRIGSKFLSAGVGYGGACFPKDVAAFTHVASSLGYDFELLRAVQAVNVDQLNEVAVKLEKNLGNLKGKTVALLGLAFKPETDDIRESPALSIGRQLIDRGVTVRAYDPVAMENTRKAGGDGFAFGDDAYDVITGADAVVLATEWTEFQDLDWPTVRRLLRGTVVLDGRNLWNPSVVRAAGLTYIGIGR